jgi:uncharacterized RDD family membrane protein YckC
VRWWDGGAWTEHLAPAAQPAAAAYGRPATTPDGAPLAGWGWHDLTRSIDTGGEAPSGTALQRELARTFLLIGLINTAINFAYHVGFLMWKQATPGKLMLGLRVRRRDVPGPMPWGTVLLRWLTQFGPSVVGTIQYVNYLISVYTLLDGLWPLWDGKRQALHDKAAKTNVVRVR